MLRTFLCLLLAQSGVFPALARAQASGTDKVAVAFSDPARRGSLEVDLVHGSITVTGYDGAEVIIEATTRTKKYSAGHESSAASGSMRRLSINSTGLVVEEEDNLMSVSTASHMRAVDLKIQVPRKTSLQLNAVNDGDIKVANIEGELDLSNVNGFIEAQGISGTVLANTTNGHVKVTFNRVQADKAMSFVSFNGDVDVTFPAGIKADVRMKSDNGEVFSDFDIALQDGPRVTRSDSRLEGGKFKLEVDSTIFGRIGGGGPEFHFSTWRGNIYLRKK